ILRDSEYRLAEVVRTGRGDTSLPGELLEEVDMYIGQVGDLLKTYGRLARSAGKSQEYYDDVRPVLARMSKINSVEESTFASTYRVVMQDFIFEVADESTLSSGAFQLGNREPDKVLKTGIDRLYAVYGEDALNWKQFRTQVKD